MLQSLETIRIRFHACVLLRIIKNSLIWHRHLILVLLKIDLNIFWLVLPTSGDPWNRKLERQSPTWSIWSADYTTRPHVVRLFSFHPVTPATGAPAVTKYIEYHSVCPFVGTGTPHPLSRKRVCPPPEPKRGGEHTRLRVRGVPIPTTWEKA